MKLHMRLYILSVLILSVALCSSAKDYGFRHLSVENGISHNQVNDVYQDSEGFMWISTAWGLNRYDGYRIKTYQTITNDTTSLKANFVHWARDIYGDKMYIRTSTGNCIYDKNTDTFSSDVSRYLPKDAYEMNAVTYVDKLYNVWVSYENELYVSIKSRTELIKVTLKQPLSASVYGMYERDHQLVYVSRNGEVGTIDISGVDLETKVIVAEPIISELKPGRNTPFIDNDGEIWVHNRDCMGLWRYAPRTDKWSYYDNSPGSKIFVPSYMIRNIIQDRDEVLWVATDHAGVILIDKRNGKVKYIKHEERDNRSIVDDATSEVYMDHEGTIWLGYYHSGLSYYNPTNFRFNVDKLDYLKDIDPTFVSNITTIEQDKKGNLWLGTNGSGLAYIDNSTKQCKVYKHDSKNPNSIPADVIVALKMADDGKLWIGTFLGGLSIFDGKTFTNFKDRKDVPESISCPSIWSIEKRHNGTIWVGTLNKGLCSYDTKTGIYTSYNRESHKIHSDYISCIEASRTTNSLYAGTEHGVMVITGTNSTPTFRILDEEKNYKILHENIHDLLEDSRGLLWVGTQSGLCIYNPVSNDITPIKLYSEVTNDFVSALAEDEEHNIWVSTADGLAYIRVSTNPTRENIYKFTQCKFTKDDGLEDGTYNQRAMKSLSDGRILVGRSFGLSEFSPIDLLLNVDPPQVHFTSLKLFGEESQSNKQIFDVTPLDKQLYLNSGEVEIPSRVSLFSVEFSTLNYILPTKTTYTCRLEGLSDEKFVTNKPEVTFANLLPGKYTLYVSATNSDGYTNNYEYSLPIRILPPWYASPIAFVVYSLLFVGLAWCLIQLCIFFLQTRNMRTIRYEYEMSDSALSEQKDVFFKAISKELSTPINNILEPIRALREEISTESPAIAQIDLLESNAKRLQESMSHIMNLHYIDSSEKLTPVRRDIVAHLHQIFESFESQSSKNVEYAFYTSQPNILMDFDTEKLTIAISNILSNAAKYTPEYGQISLSVEAHPETVTISIADTGIGIADKYKEYVFDKFYQAPNSKSSGYGIGLHVAHGIVKLHNGTIVVKDNPNGKNGVQFIITLPYLQKGSKNIVKRDIDESTLEPDVADSKIVEQARKLIIANVQMQYAAEDLARNLKLSRIQLYKKIMAVTGLAPVEFIRKVRLQHAAEMLKETNVSIARVAKESGFSNVDYFLQYFKEEFGKDVEEYRQSLMSKSSDQF